jgi:hypothetical protein
MSVGLLFAAMVELYLLPAAPRHTAQPHLALMLRHQTIAATYSILTDAYSVFAVNWSAVKLLLTGLVSLCCYCCSFHDVEPQPGLALMPPSRLSRAVVLGGARRIPRPRLGENTLLLADELVVTQAADGRWFVAVR